MTEVPVKPEPKSPERAPEKDAEPANPNTTGEPKRQDEGQQRG